MIVWAILAEANNYMLCKGQVVGLARMDDAIGFHSPDKKVVLSF
jgi:hypothetical protein